MFISMGIINEYIPNFINDKNIINEYFIIIPIIEVNNIVLGLLKDWRILLSGPSRYSNMNTGAIILIYFIPLLVLYINPIIDSFFIIISTVYDIPINKEKQSLEQSFCLGLNACNFTEHQTYLDFWEIKKAELDTCTP